MGEKFLTSRTWQDVERHRSKVAGAHVLFHIHSDSMLVKYILYFIILFVVENYILYYIILYMEYIYICLVPHTFRLHTGNQGCFLSDPGRPGPIYVSGLCHWVTFCELNWCDSGWWRYQLNTNCHVMSCSTYTRTPYWQTRMFFEVLYSTYTRTPYWQSRMFF